MRDRAWWGAGLVVLTLTALRIWFANRIELLPEEAYYWMYAQNPSLSYYDHPPMVAWLIRLGTTLLGHTEVGVRSVTWLLALGSCGLMYWLGRAWFGVRVGVQTMLLFCLIPIYAGVSFFAMPDGPLVFFWLATLAALTQALDLGERVPAWLLAGSQRVERRRTGYWVLAGLCFGGALLSKYTALLLAPSFLLFLWWSPRHRVWLRRPQPWLAMLTALTVFSPVVLWNAQHHWASFLFQSTRTVGQHHHLLRDHLLFWVMQIGILTPLVFALLAATIRQGLHYIRNEQHSIWAMALAFALPLLVVFMVASLKTRVHINWTAPAFLSLLPAGVAWFRRKLESAEGLAARRWRRLGWASGLVGVTAWLTGLGVLAFGGPLGSGYRHVGGWRSLSQTVEQVEHRLESQTGHRAFVLGMDKYNLAAELGFYSGEPAEHVNSYAVGEQGLGFRYWTDLQQWSGHPAVVVMTQTNADLFAELNGHFASIGAIQPMVVPSLGTRKRMVYLVNCEGYRPHDQPVTAQ